jgi:hypothetical protein
MIELKHNADEVAAAIQERGERLRQEMRSGMLRAMIMLARYIGTQKLSGQSLKVRTGTGRRAVMGSAAVTESGESVIGSVSNDPASWYLRVQHEGAHIPAVSGKLMVFPVSAGGAKKGGMRDMVFTMKRRAFDIRPKPFMREALEEQRDMIIEELDAAMRRALA